jgi:iron(III) transport system permease protein
MVRYLKKIIPIKKYNAWEYFFFGIILFFIFPAISIIITATGDTENLWSHISTTVLPRYISNTLQLMLGVGLLTLLLGISSAWIIVRYEFPGRTLMQWMLLLPAAIPSYLIAYTYTDFLEYAGPFQGLIRDYFGWTTTRDYWFPEIRSMGGAIFVMGFVLYPYVYIMARTSFTLTPKSFYDAGTLMNRSIFWSIALPLSRPAVIAGLALVLMETMSDFGTVDYFSIETLSLGIFNVWLGMNNLTVATQIASLSFIFIISLITMEVAARSRRTYSNTSNAFETLERKSLSISKMLVCMFICLLPIIFGFLIPVSILFSFVLEHKSIHIDQETFVSIWHSMVIAISVAFIVVVVSGYLGCLASFSKRKIIINLLPISSFGYAFPGVILAIGVITTAGYIDNEIAFFAKSIFSYSYLGGLTSGIGLVIFACVIRFQVIGNGAFKTSISRLSPNLIDSSKVLGNGFFKTATKIIFPLTVTSYLGAAILVFVEVIKELPMVLLLRPFNYETMSTLIYQLAKEELLEEAALPALIMIFTGIIPVIIINNIINRKVDKHR